MIRQVPHALLTAEFEVFDGEEKVGAARVYEGVITVLAADTDLHEDYKGQVLSVLLRNICVEANNCNANLSIMIPETPTSRLKRVLERFAFRETHKNIFKRTAGAAIPPSVIY
jgi:hypothetical protein